jgi:hypothetical protein
MFYRQPTIKIQSVDGLSFVHFFCNYNEIQCKYANERIFYTLYFMKVMLAHGISGEPSTMTYLRAATVHYSWAEISE